MGRGALIRSRLDGIERNAWLRDSLTMMVNEQPVHCLDDLLPWSGRADELLTSVESRHQVFGNWPKTW
jgi:hypothetical protein